MTEGQRDSLRDDIQKNKINQKKKKGSIRWLFLMPCDLACKNLLILIDKKRLDEKKKILRLLLIIIDKCHINFIVKPTVKKKKKNSF